MTLLFTDLVGSTRLKEELGNTEALRLIHEHHALVRALLREFSEAFEVSTAGDSFFLAFRKPSDAVCFALRLQSRLATWNRRNRRKLLDRVGIHSGEVTVEVDENGRARDLHGLEVDKCARVMSLGRENHILLTRFAFDNARASLKGERIPEVSGIQWVSHGFYELKGVADPMEICEVCETGRTTLEPPEDSEKARRVDGGGDTVQVEAPRPGWRGWWVGRRIRPRSAWIGGSLAAAIGLVVLMVPIFRPLTMLSYDLSYALRTPVVPTNAVIVRMDPQSETELGQPADQRWDRRIHAQLIRKMAAFGARAVVLDILFREPTTPEEDQPLIDAARSFGRVAVAGRLTKHVQHDVYVQSTIEGPFLELGTATHWGLSHFPVEMDQVVRQPHSGSSERDHLAVEVVRMLNGTPPDPARIWLNYYGPPGTIPSYSYAHVLGDLVPPENFQGRLVFVGAAELNRPAFTKGWMNDEGATPYTRRTGQRSSGVEIVATSTLNLLQGDWLRRPSPWLEILGITLAGLGAGYVLGRLRPVPCLVGGVLLAGGAAILALSLVGPTRYWVPWLIFSAVQVPVAVVWSTIAWAEAAGRLRAAGARSLTRTATRTARIEVPQGGGDRGSVDRPAGDVRSFEIAGYKLIREIGHGAYGTVWLARDVVGLYRAVKIVRRDGFSDERPYEREFGGIKRYTPISLEHPGLVRVLHVGRDDQVGFFHYVMEAADDLEQGVEIDPERYVPRTLAAELERAGSLSPTEVARLGVMLGEALGFLHQRRLIHRDIKPANILYVRGTPRLGDIGLVTDVAEPGQSVSFLGTKGYLPPEGPGSPSADLFSLGRLLYVAATGRSAENYPEMPGDLKAGKAPERIGPLQRIWEKACEESAARRHASAAELVEDLQRFLREAEC